MNNQQQKSAEIAANFKGAVYSYVVADALAMPFKWYKPADVKHLVVGSGFSDRLGNDFMPFLPAGYTTRDTEALIAILKSSQQLPDLLHFAFNLKAAFTTFPEKWRYGTVFPWPPFPDKSHFTLAFAIPAAYKLAHKDVDHDQILAWILRLSPSSVIWQQCIYVYTVLLAGLISGAITKATVWAEADKLAEGAESLFPGASLLDPFLNSLEGHSTNYSADPRFQEGMLEHAHAALSLAIHAFANGGDSLASIVQPLALLAGDTAVSCYAASFWGAANGFQALPEELVNRLPDSVRLASGVNNITSKLAGS